MKKKLIKISIVLLLIAVVAVLVVGFFLGDIVKAGMETVGPKVTQTTLTVGSVHVGILTGSGGVKNLALGNPDDYKAKAPNAITVGKAAVSVAPFSVLSDKIVIKSVEVRDAEIFFDGKLPFFTQNNLKKIQDNVTAFVGSQDKLAATNAPAKQKPAKKLQVDDFLIAGAKVHFQGRTLPLPPIHLSNLGTGPDGITPAALVKDVLDEISTATIKVVLESLSKLSQGSLDAGKDAGKAIGDGAGKTIKNLGGLLGK